MPFVQRRVEPNHLSRTRLFDDDGHAKVRDDELQAVTNNTLCNALRQLASLASVANDIFEELGGQLGSIRERADVVQVKIRGLEERVDRFDPKEVTVPESDICTFAALKRHYAAPQTAPDAPANLFAPSTRPAALEALYAAAAKTPVHLMRQLDRWRRDGRRTSGFFLCTPVLGARRRAARGGRGAKVDVDIDIETSVPAAVEDLRRWTSNEALGDITVTLDCNNRITSAAGDGDTTDGTLASDDEGLDHKLPSPEEQVQVVALKFPAEIVAVDVSGRSFDRMSTQRRSLMTPVVEAANSSRRRTRTRKPRSRRRNTLAGTDQKEIREAIIAGEDKSSPTFNRESEHGVAVCRSKSSDLLRSTTKKDCPETKKSHFNTLKQWGKTRYDRLMNKSADKNESKSAKDDLDDTINVYETVTANKRKRDGDVERRTHDRNASISSSEKSSINVPVMMTNNALSSVMSIAVRLRESSAQRRLRRTGGNKEEPHSSSGNWSASSESGRASIGSEITTATTQPKSTTSAATSNNSLNVPSSVNSRRRFVNNSASSSVTSEGTLTPDIIHDLHEDGETSSVYSCDTEGYYTSFHVDSGLKTLKEEDTPPTPLHSTSAFSTLSAENEYELFGRGSTSTTTSSAGTVCTTLRAADSTKSLTVMGPAVPERKSSLTKLSSQSPESSLERDFGDKTGTVKRSPATKPVVVAMVHKQNNEDGGGGVSPDSGHNTSSSPIESVSSPNGVRTNSDFEFSESSDMEGAERIERIRVKTTINSSRIPSMCVITPSHSDDESSNSSNSSGNNYHQKRLQERNNLNQEANDGKDTDKVHHIINTMVNGASKLSLVSVNPRSGYATVQRIEHTEKPTNTTTTTMTSSNAIRAPSPSGGIVTIKETLESKSPTQPIIKASLLPLNNMFGRLKTNLANLAHKRDRSKSPNADAGEYVTIADIRNNNEKVTRPAAEDHDVVNRNLTSVLSGKMRDAEYVSLDELPCNENNNLAHTYANLEAVERSGRQGAKVTVDAEGKVIYNSDSLRRRRNCHTTFQPGKNVKTPDRRSESPLPVHRTPKSVRPVTTTTTTTNTIATPNPTRGAGPISPAHKKERVQPPANPQQIPNAALGSSLHMSPSPQEMYAYGGDRVLDMDINRYLPNQYYLQRGSPKYSTLPSKKTNYLAGEARPQRSVTPDITRGLERKADKREAFEESPRTFYTFSKNAPTKRTDSRNASTTPTSYDEPDSLKISPIDPRHCGGFQSSTPSSKATELRAAVNLDRQLLSPKKSTMSNEELYAVIHKSKKKMNIEAVETPRSSPVTVQEPLRQSLQTPESGYLGDRSRGRLSWSPNKGDYVGFDKLSPPHESKNRQSWACSDRKAKPKQTSTIDFKRLLLQKSSSSSPKKMSAVEQLKLSREQVKPQAQPQMNILDLSASPRSLVNRRFLGNQPGSPSREPKPASKIMSPRSQWRFANPRSDVLSSTILEDCREDESANSSGERKKASPKAGDGVGGANEKSLTSASQRLYARRAQFFSSPAEKSNDDRSRVPEIGKQLEQPTLETAF